MSWLLLALVLSQAPVDEGTFVIRQDTVVLARETFQLAAARNPSGPVGWTLRALVRYDRDRNAVVLAPVLSLARDSLPWSLEFAVEDPRKPVRILGQAARDRFTTRTLGERSEGAREYQLAAPTVVLDDSVFSPYLFLAWQARAGRPVQVTALLPREDRRDVLVLEDLGLATTTVNRDLATLRHIVGTGGANGVVDLWLDPGGRLMRIDIPSRHVRVERLSPA